MMIIQISILLTKPLLLLICSILQKIIQEERAENAYKDIIKGFDVNADPFFLGKTLLIKH